MAKAADADENKKRKSEKTLTKCWNCGDLFLLAVNICLPKMPHKLKFLNSTFLQRNSHPPKHLTNWVPRHLQKAPLRTATSRDAILQLHTNRTGVKSRCHGCRKTEPHEPGTRWQQKTTQKPNDKFHQVIFDEGHDALPRFVVGVINGNSSPHQKCGHVCRSTFPDSPLPTPPFAVALVPAHLPMSPPTQPTWSSSCSVLRSRSLGCQGLPSRARGGTSVLGSRWLRVTTNVFIRDLDLTEFRGLDGRGGSRSSLMGCLLSTPPNKPLTQRWCHTQSRRHREARSCFASRCGIGRRGPTRRR